MSNKKSIQVAIKVRPLLPKQKESNCWSIIENSIKLLDSHGQAGPYYFDHIFDQDANNEMIFDKMARPIIQAGIKGFNGTIFAYGQTSSGKTYTMIGDEQNPGVMTLAAKEIFREIEKSTDRRFVLRVGFIEIYNEKIGDLLNRKNQDIKIHETPTGTISLNCEEKIITCEDDLLHNLIMGNKERTVGETSMNERSSRSHAIFRIIIESRNVDRSEDDAVTQSVLNLVDLAGSERANQTGACGARLKEGGHINKSLLFLSTVIKRLSENEDDKYISYRDSKLTRILQASLGGNALTSIICTIKPTAVEETQSTLSFATRAKTIKNKPEVNEVVSDATMMKRLERELRELKSLLAKERNNESQIKVGQLEERINNEVLKIITSNSLHNIRSLKEKRRRTWCPTSTIDTNNSLELPLATINPASIPTTKYDLLKPGKFLTPHITLRQSPESQLQPLDIEEEIFKPGELCNFDEYDVSPIRNSNNQIKNKDSRTLSLTPQITSNAKLNLEIVENTLLELQEFTNLENTMDVKHNAYDCLKQKLEIVTARNKILEKTRIECVEVTEQLIRTKEHLSDSEKRCCDLELKFSKLTDEKKAGSDKIIKYEKELEEFKKTIEKLEMENKEAICLEFEFQRQKNKSNLRETELLDVLAEKENEIKKLEKSLNSLSEEQLRNSKEKLMQSTYEDANDKAGNICIKCEDLQRLVEENKKLTVEFDKLTVEYEKLKLNCEQTNTDAINAQELVAELKQIHDNDEVQCLELRSEIQLLRDKLLGLQKEYEELNCEKNSKTDDYNKLNQILNEAREEMHALQDKYDKLEVAWREQQLAIAQIQVEYDAIQHKYQNLLAQYERLDSTSTKSLDDCSRLQKENESLQLEINTLKMRVEEMQERFHQMAQSHCNDNTKLQQKNSTLIEQLEEMKKQFEDLQKEYDVLSNQVIDNLQEEEILRETNKKLEAKLIKLEFEDKFSEDAQKNLEEEINNLKSQLEIMSATAKCNCKNVQSSMIDSIYSSGVCMEKEIASNACNLLNKFFELNETVQVVEIEHVTGEIRRFTSVSAKSISTSAPSYKLLLKNIYEVVANEEDNSGSGSGLCNSDTKVRMQGVLKRHTFHIVETEAGDGSNNVQLDDINCPKVTSSVDAFEEFNVQIKQLNNQILQLKTSNQQLLDEKQTIIAENEQIIIEMREEVTRLSEELFEKSLFVEQCTCEDYRKQIECLEKEQAEITIVCEELQEKNKKYLVRSMILDANETLYDANSSREEINKNDTVTLNNESQNEQTTIIQLKRELQKQAEQLQMKTGFIEDLEKRCEMLQNTAAEHKMQHEQMETELKSLNLQLQIKVKENKTECDRIKLELCAKLENSESEAREHLRKHREWQTECANYEQTINHLKDKVKQQSYEIQTLEKYEQQNKENAILLKENSDTIQKLLEQLEGQGDLLEICEALRSEKENNQQNEKRLQEVLEEKNTLQQELNHCVMQKQKNDSSVEQELHTLKAKVAEIDAINSTCEALRMKNSKMEQELSELNVEKQKVVTRLQEMLEKETSRNTFLNTLQEEYTTTKKLLEEKTAIIADLSLQIEDKESLKNEFNLLTSTCNTLRAEKIKLEQQIFQIMEEKKKIEATLKDALEERSDYDKLLNTLEEKLESIITLQKEKETLEASMQFTKIEFEKTVQELKQERDNLKLTLDNNKSIKIALEQKVDIFETKIYKLSQELSEANTKAKSLEDLLSNYNNMEKLLDSVNVEKHQLREQLHKLQLNLKDLEKSQSISKENNEVQRREVKELTEQLNVAIVKAKNVEGEKLILQKQLDSLNEKIDNECDLKRQCKDLQSALSELRLKYQTLLETNTQLEQANKKVQQQYLATAKKAAECETLQKNLKQLQEELLEIRQCMQTTVDEAGKCSKALQEDVACHKTRWLEQKQESDHLRSALHSKEVSFKSEKQKMEGTISCLLLEKKNLEEKLLKKLETEFRKMDSTSSSYESSGSSSTQGRKSIDRLFGESSQLNSVNVNLEDKLLAKQKLKPSCTESMERKNRRLSTHDERRQPFWCPTRTIGIMTDPSDSNCSCAELDIKLKECERNLFIRESHVMALNMELRNHPLKTENALLKKRIQEEQDRHSNEVKKYKHIIVEQTTKAAHVDNSSSASKFTPPKILANSEAQTEFELDACLHKLQGKYNDLKNICRHRYNVIKELENKVAGKENANCATPVSVQETSQLLQFQQQCATLQKELETYKLKYQDAKKVLQMRLDEIHRLRKKLVITEANDGTNL